MRADEVHFRFNCAFHIFDCVDFLITPHVPGNLDAEPNGKCVMIRAFTQFSEFDLDFHCLAHRSTTEITDSTRRSPAIHHF